MVLGVVVRRLKSLSVGTFTWLSLTWFQSVVARTTTTTTKRVRAVRYLSEGLSLRRVKLTQMLRPLLEIPVHAGVNGQTMLISACLISVNPRPSDPRALFKGRDTEG